MVSLSGGKVITDKRVPIRVKSLASKQFLVTNPDRWFRRPRGAVEHDGEFLPNDRSSPHNSGEDRTSIDCIREQNIDLEGETEANGENTTSFCRGAVTEAS